MSKQLYQASPRRQLWQSLLGAVGVCAGVALDCSGVEKAVAQDVVLRNWDLDDGLPSTRVNDIARTPDGYLWLATQRGLVRFDGTTFVTVNITNLPADKTPLRARCLLVDGKGDLWIGVRDRLLRRTGSDFEIKDLGATTGGGALNDMAEDSDGALWLATEGAGLVRLRRGEAERFGVESGLPSAAVAQVVCDAAGRLWAVAGRQLVTLQSGRWQTPAGMPANSGLVQTLAPAREGGVWVACTEKESRGPAAGVQRGVRLHKAKDGRWTSELEPYPWPEDSQQYQGFALLEDRRGRVWCATAGGVFCWKPPGAWQRLVSETPWVQIEALQLVEDDTGSLWIGTRTTGLLQVQDRPVMTFSLPAAAAQNAVLTVCVARDGSVWSGTDGAGIFRWAEGESTQFGSEHGLRDLHVAALVEDRHGTLWAGTLAGLFRWTGQRFEPAGGPRGLQEPTLALREDRAGRLWIGGQAGLIQLNSSGAEVFGEDEGLGLRPVRALAEDNKGHIWAGTSQGGLFRQEGRRFVRVATPKRPIAWSVRALHFDAAGALWIATDYSGLLRLREGQFSDWDWSRDGLPSNFLMAIAEDSRGNLWMSSENGIFGCSKPMLDACFAKPPRRLQPWRLTTADGLASKVCSGIGQPATAQSDDGRLWFPNGPALAVFDPATFAQPPRIWPPLIEGVRVDGVAVSVVGDGLRVQSGARQIEFQYTSPNTVLPERLRFRVRMAGLDLNWVDLGTRRESTYYRLPPGQYEFQVMTSGPQNDWMEGRGLKLEIVPRFWERRSLQFASALVLLATVAMIVWSVERSRSRRRLERLEAQRKLEQERARIAKDIHDDLGASLTHITMLSQSARTHLGDLPEAGAEVDQIYGTARALTRSMEEVVWAVSPKHDTLDSLANYLGIYAQDFAGASGLRCRLDLPAQLSQRPLNSQVRHNVFLAFKEALHNVARHAGASEVRVSLKQGEQEFTLTVEDNGRGFRIDHTATAEPAPSTRPARLLSGHGLANMRSRLQEVGGRCEIEGQYGLGTTVRFVVPFVT
ncbi:MAG: ATP-binding protein [Verrucomicrobia bacterium]|nr:ATP-binding protein [Verrucomicrobiota bacterium]